MSTITHKHRERPSLFGPIVLIAVGLFFLFNRLNFITDLHWGDVLRLWPLFLIFLGLNILVQQAPRPFGTLLSGVVALLAVAIFGYILVVGVRGSLFGGTLPVVGFGNRDSGIPYRMMPAGVWDSTVPYPCL